MEFHAETGCLDWPGRLVKIEAISTTKSHSTFGESMLVRPTLCNFVRSVRLPHLARVALLPGIITSLALIGSLATLLPVAARAELQAGAAKIDITDYESGPVSDPLYVKALVIKDAETTAVIITVDAVAIGEIGRISNEYLGRVREAVGKELKIPATHFAVNASHCHGRVHKDVEARTIQAVLSAHQRLTPVTVGAGVGREERIMENRRLLLKSGKEADVRHAYSLPPDAEVAEVGPADPEIGILRLDRKDTGGVLAVVYNFAVHPIQGMPGNANTADITGFASQVIEDNLSDDAVALFVQGCAGDINPISYKAVDHPRLAEPLGHRLGLSALKGIRKIKTRDISPSYPFQWSHRTLDLPRANLAERIVQLETERERLVGSLQGTSLNLKTFLPLIVKYRLDEDFPSYYSHRYLHEAATGRDDFKQLDAENRRSLKAYLQNIYTMEQLTRVQTNLRLLKKHQADLVDSGKRTINVELTAWRLGDFRMVTFPGELTVRIGLGLKERSPHPLTFIAGYTNGYIYYAPTAEQLKNVGNAQEDSDCILAPAWQAKFEAAALEMLQKQ